MTAATTTTARRYSHIQTAVYISYLLDVSQRHPLSVEQSSVDHQNLVVDHGAHRQVPEHLTEHAGKVWGGRGSVLIMGMLMLSTSGDRVAALVMNDPRIFTIHKPSSTQQHTRELG